MGWRDWSTETRTGLDLVTDWIEANFRSKAEAARALGLAPDHLRIWLLQPDRGLTKEIARRVAKTVGIPFIAVVFKTSKVCDVLSDEDEVAAG